ncbi:retrotransposon protein, putative, ty1-copia subclass, partial [Tanacetum coccineum]
ALILYRSSMPFNLLDRYYGFMKDSEGQYLRDYDEPDTLNQAINGWLEVMNTEMQSMKDNEVCDLVNLLLENKVICCKWVFKKKTNMDGNVNIFKARLVAKGYTQTQGVDYSETYLLIVSTLTIRILFDIAAYYDYKIWKMDVKTAFLNGHLFEDVYMEQPEAFQSSKFSKIMENFKRGWVTAIVKKYFSDSQCPTTCKERRRMGKVLYASTIGSIMYAMTCTRPEVSYALNMTSRFKFDPREEH